MTPTVLAELNRLEQARRRRWAIGLPVAAAVALMLIGGGVFAYRALPRPSAEVGRLVEVAPVKETLPDGSIVELKAGAEVTVDFSPTVRAVTLRQGEALFTVAKNPARPFVVTSGGITVQAVGTAFAINLSHEQVELLVTEGRVAVAEKTPSTQTSAAVIDPMKPALVDAGQQAVLSTGEAGRSFAVAAIAPEELEARLDWRTVRLEFAGAPLSRVVAAFNQHNAQRLVLAEPALGDLQISGNLRADKIQDLLHMLEVSFHIHAEHRGKDEIFLRQVRGEIKP